MDTLFTSVEFYIIAFIVAVAIVAFFVRPQSSGEAMTLFYKALIEPCELTDDNTDNESLIITALDDNYLRIVHTCVYADYDTIPAIAMTVIGSDIKIIEKQEPMASHDAPLMNVTYIIDRLHAVRYHLYFDSALSGRYATGSIVNEPPFHTTMRFT